jgi:hypothetical protein
LFILTEDQGPHMGAFGTAGVETPHMDLTARKGILFTQAYVAYRTCSASKAALYTGLYPHTNGVRSNTVNYHKPADEVTAEERNHPLARRMRMDDRFFYLHRSRIRENPDRRDGIRANSEVNNVGSPGGRNASEFYDNHLMADT